MHFLMVLLQGTSPAAVAQNEEATRETVTVWELILSGGWMMIPIFILSVVAVYLIIERYLSLKKSDKDPESFMEHIKDMVFQGDINGARKYCQDTNTPFSRMLEKGVAKIGKPLANIEASIENIGRIEIYRLERGINGLATIAGAAPMLGFLGTVMGMVSAFMSMAQAEGDVTTKALSSGIYQAMMTTVAGLIVGIIAYIGYNWLTGKVEKIIHQMEYSSVEFIELLQEPR